MSDQFLRNMRRRVLLAAAGYFLIFESQAFAQSLPVSGPAIPELQAIDSAMSDFMSDNGITAGVAAIMKDGVPIYRRAFGWQDADQTVPLRHNTVFRLASLTKPLTAAVIRNLISDGSLGLHDRVFSLGSLGSGLLDYQPFGVPDSRLSNITVDHLLRHRGGWNREAAGPGNSYRDLTYQERRIASDMGLDSPPGRDATVRWIMGQPLQFNPGTQESYSNIGYLLLGLIAERVDGKPLIEQFQQDLFAPLGVPASQIVAGRTFAADQDNREPYYDGGLGYQTNVFYPTHSSEPFVLPAYGSFDLEARIGQGGVVADPLAILEFLEQYQANGPGIGGPRPMPGAWRWNHTGSLDGVSTLARQRGDGINYVVFFNKDTNGTSYSGQIRTIIDEIIDSGQIANWPTADVREFVPEPSAIVLVFLATFVAMSMRSSRK